MKDDFSHSALEADAPLDPRHVARDLWQDIAPLYGSDKHAVQQGLEAQLIAAAATMAQDDTELSHLYPINDPETAMRLQLLGHCSTYIAGDLREILDKGVYWLADTSNLTDAYIKDARTALPDDMAQKHGLFLCGPYVVVLPRAESDFKNLPVVRRGLNALHWYDHFWESGLFDTECTRTYPETHRVQQKLSNIIDDSFQTIDYAISYPRCENTRPAIAGCRLIQNGWHQLNDKVHSGDTPEATAKRRRRRATGLAELKRLNYLDFNIVTSSVDSKPGAALKPTQ